MKNPICFLLLTSMMIFSCSKQESPGETLNVNPDFFAQKWQLIETSGNDLLTETYEMIKGEAGLEQGDQGMQAWPDQSMMIWNFDAPSKFPTTEGTWSLSKDQNDRYSLDLELTSWPNRRYEITKLTETRMVLQQTE